jgi:NYN domain
MPRGWPPRSVQPNGEYNMSGAILIDGHHVFLEILNDVDRFNKLAGGGPLADNFAKGTVNIWSPPTARHLSGLARENLEWNLPRAIEHPLPVATDPKDVQIAIFDAKLPPRAEMTRRLESNRPASQAGRYNSMASDVKLRQVRDGWWSFRYDDRFIDTPYELKNDFVDELSSGFKLAGEPSASQMSDWFWSGSKDWKARLGTRKTIVKANGTFHEHEKGVDTQLVIHACSLAMDARVRWVCLVTNDSDYVPLVHHLHHHAKSVYWLPYARNKSGGMLKAITSNNVIEKAHAQSSYSDRNDFQSIQELHRRSVVLQKATPGKDTSSKQLNRLFYEDPAIEHLFMKCMAHALSEMLQPTIDDSLSKLEELRKSDPERYRALMKDIPF